MSHGSSIKTTALEDIFIMSMQNTERIMKQTVLQVQQC